jgi:hypothetical protein
MRNCLAYALLAAAFCAFAESNPVKDRNIKELSELNKLVVENSADISKYENKTVWMKAKILELPDNRLKVKIEELSASEPSPGAKKETVKKDSDVYIKGKIIRNADRTFKLDIEHVLPPEN